MGYINFRIGKLKTPAKMAQARAHNQRIAFCENTDSARRFMNRQIMDCAPDYEEFFEKRIEESPFYQQYGKKIRHDAVHALDMEFRVNAEEMHENPYFDLDKFCDETRKWVCKKFGAENVVDLVLHMDEGYGEQDGKMKFAPHIHAIVIPMTKDGRLSAAEFIGTPRKLNELQTEVAEQYKSMHLKRGQEKSVAKHTEMKEFYGWVHAARVVNLPEPGEHETAVQYATRIKPEVQKIQSQRLNEVLQMQNERDSALTRIRQLEAGINTGKEDVEELKKELEKREKEMQKREAEIKKDFNALQQWRDVLSGLGSGKVPKEEAEKCLATIGEAIKIGSEMRRAAEEERQKETEKPDDSPAPQPKK